MCKAHADVPGLRYYYKDNSGPGQSRNFGVEKALGEYMIILDSDVVLPECYLEAIDSSLEKEDCDAFGGSDAAAEDFTPVQKAISYSMTSFFTTGGIRGGKRKLDRFYPRSFNMGIKKDVYEALGGFSKMRFGEDIDFSIRIIKGGYSCRLLPEAWVWHKRRTDFRKFFRQVYNSGISIINLYKKYPESLKLVHILPAAFTLSLIVLVPTGLILLFILLVGIDSTLKNKSLKVGLLSIWAAIVQLTGYGSGFIIAWWRRCVLGRDEFTAFNKTFYK